MSKVLIQICPDTLNTLSDQWDEDRLYSFATVNDEVFFTASRKGNIFENTGEYFLRIYKWNQCLREFEQSIKVELENHPGRAHGNLGGIRRLTGNRYCCPFLGHNTKRFELYIFEIDPDSLSVNELGVIKPKAQHSGAGSTASGSIEILPDGNLVTYHECHDNVQLWDSRTLKCIKEWNWKDIKIPGEFKVWRLKLIALMDSSHLLVHYEHTLFLFNMLNLQMKQIVLPSKLQADYFGKHHVLANGQVLAFVCKPGELCLKVVYG